jgi:hypothetical protein
MEFELPELEKKVFKGQSLDISMCSEDEIEKMQLGYSVSINGDPLYGFDEGDWQEGWVVIGYETGCGDPIFIDLNEGGLPVYTAMHGCGVWSPQVLSESYCDFIKVLNGDIKPNSTALWQFFFGVN